MLIDNQELDEKVMEGLISALLTLTTNDSPRWLVNIIIIIIMIQFQSIIIM